jgi:segregation and condensation protein B
MKRHIEALIFAAPQPVPAAELKSVLEEALQTEVSAQEVEAALAQIRAQFQEEQYAFELVEIAGGYQFMTKGAYHNTVAVHLKQTTKKRLSQAALETLALVAYKQPVIKSELEEIRGVNCDYAIQKLLEKELIAIAGRSEGPGRPLLYATSEKFMDYLGINSLQDLPKPKDFKELENSIGEAPA